ITDAVVDGETGLLFEVKNVSALESCIRTMAIDSEFRTRLGRQAMNRVHGDFSCNQLGLAWLNYYRDLS
ncbi:MAG: glycosyltransferase, partial [Methylotenera sp.]